MWQIEWMLQLIPDNVFTWITAIIFFGGILAYIASKLVSILPFVGRYKIAIELGSIAALIVGSYFFCGVVYRAQVAELKEKVKIAEQQSKEANDKLAQRTEQQIKVVKETVYVNKEIIKNTVGRQIDAQCSVPNSVISLHDSASRNEVARGAAIADGATSKFKASELLGTVIDNYGSCHENAAKLRAWQDWYREQKKIFEQVK